VAGGAGQDAQASLRQRLFKLRKVAGRDDLLGRKHAAWQAGRALLLLGEGGIGRAGCRVNSCAIARAWQCTVRAPARASRPTARQCCCAKHSPGWPDRGVRSAAAAAAMKRSSADDPMARLQSLLLLDQGAAAGPTGLAYFRLVHATTWLWPGRPADALEALPASGSDAGDAVQARAAALRTRLRRLLGEAAAIPEAAAVQAFQRVQASARDGAALAVEGADLLPATQALEGLGHARPCAARQRSAGGPGLPATRPGLDRCRGDARHQPRHARHLPGGQPLPSRPAGPRRGRPDKAAGRPRLSGHWGAGFGVRVAR
jgi:hypothetical protein